MDVDKHGIIKAAQAEHGFNVPVQAVKVVGNLRYELYLQGGVVLPFSIAAAGAASEPEGAASGAPTKQGAGLSDEQRRVLATPNRYNKEALRVLAVDLGIAGAERMTKKLLVAALRKWSRENGVSS